MELRILGPLEVSVGRRVVAPSAGKQRSLLAFLILHANERVHADRLIDALWGERPPPTAAAALQNQVTRLRRLLGAERIDTAGSTYLLHVAPGELDVDRFEELVRRARSAPPRERADLLRAALAIWRGRALGDVDGELFAESEILRLEELRLAVLEERIEAELELGESASLVPELEALAHAHPLREGVRAKLMLALYRSGRQADALEVYQQTRRLLVDELGIEPQQPLQLLHQRILLQHGDLDAEPPPPEAAESEPPPAPIPPREVRKSVTVALLSVELPPGADPEVLRGLGERAAFAVRLAVERNGGRVQETAGASVLAVFGVPLLHEDDALRALRAADEARASMVELAPGLELRAGVATGVVIAGTDAAGAPVQAARELEHRAHRGEILLSPTTQRLVRDAVACEPVGEDALRLLRLDPTAPGVARRPDALLVDRERELLLLETSFAHTVRSSTCHLFTVCGEAGIGKSRLVAELVRTVGDQAVVLAGRCFAFGDGITYLPVIEIVRSAAGIGADDPAAVRERIAALVPGRDGEAVADRLAGLLGLGPPAAADEIAWALRRLIETLAADRPVVVVVDDLHDAEPTLLELLEGLAERSRGAPILLVGIARPELLDLRPTWGGGQANATTVSLDPLDARESGLLLANLPGGSELAPEVRARVVEAAGGHPLFVEELLRMLSEAGTEHGDDELSLPPTVQVLLAARLERLPDAERLVLECGAVEGEVFHADAVAALAPELAPDAREAALAALARKDLIRPAEPQIARGDAFRFRHALLREEAYEALPKSRRAALHEAFAGWLETTGAQRLAELEEILAFHLEQAFRLREELGSLDGDQRALGERAGHLLAAAGRRAFERSDMPAAASMLGRSAALLPDDDDERLRVLVDLGGVLRARGEFERADDVLLEAARRAEATGRRGTRAHAELERAILCVRRVPAGAEKMEEVAAALVADPAAAEDPVAVAKALSALAVMRWNALESGAAAELYRRARELADATGKRSLRRTADLGFALTCVTGPMPVDDALATLTGLAETCRGDRLAEACLLTYRGALESLRGGFEEARSLFAQGTTQLDDLGYPVLRAVLDDYAVLAELAAGDAARAERIARRAFDTLSALGDRGEATLLAAGLAEALHRQGRDDEAEPLLAIAATAGEGALLAHARALATTAKVLTRRGEVVDGEQVARDLVALVELTDALVLRGDAQLALGEALLAGGRAEEAAQAAAAAAALYEARGATALAALAARLGSRAETPARRRAD